MQSRAVSRTPIWPYIGIVICLFLLTVLAPRSWQTERTVRLGQGPSHVVPSGELIGRPAADSSSSEAAASSARESGPPFVAEITSIDRSEPAMPVRQPRPRTQIADPYVKSHRAAGRPASLDQLSPAGQVAELAPRFADQIAANERATEAPALPVTPPAEPRAAAPPQSRVPRSARPVVPPPTRTAPEPNADRSQLGQAWPYPVKLIRELRQLQTSPLCRSWSRKLVYELEQLCRQQSISQAPVTPQLRRISTLAAEAKTLADNADEDLRARIARTAYAVERRLAVWQLIHQVAVTGGDSVPVARHRPLRPAIDQLENHLEAAGLQAWHRYLKLTELRIVDQSGDATTRTGLARQVLVRLDADRVNRSQREVLVAQPFQTFAAALRTWASEPLDTQRLLRTIEAFEETGDSRLARQVAQHIRLAGWSSNASVLSLSRSLDRHYRNANLRLTVTDDLLNRLLPQQSTVEEPVEEEFLGAWLSGTSQVSTELKLVLIPDPVAWRMGVEASGKVTSNTLASKGPASFCSQGTSRFFARKLLLVDRDGIQVRFAEAGAESDTDLQWLATEYDGVPVVGWLVRTLAMQEHGDRFYEAQQEAAARIEQRASKRLDDEVHTQLRQFENDFQAKLLAPLNQLQLDPVALDMQTTNGELVVRSRLAGGLQLAAHTPRPRSPDGSWISVQLHETILNNTIEQLQLGGRRSDLRQLLRDIADALQYEDWQLPDDIPSGVTIQFARHDPVRIAFDEGRAVVTMRIAELKHGRRRWRNFAARAFYVPDPTHQTANLVRDAEIRLPEGSFRLGAQIAVRLIFSKVFSNTRPVSLISERLAGSPAVADLQVSQFVVHDGWIGAALSPPQLNAEPPQVAQEQDSQTPMTPGRRPASPNRF